MSDHQQYREWSAAYVLGSLDADERAEFETHLASCEECRQDVVSLAPLPGLLSRVESEKEAAPPRIAELASRTMRSEWEGLRQSRRHWRWAAAVAASAAVFALLLLLIPQEGQETGTALVFAPESVASGTVLIVEPTGTGPRADASASSATGTGTVITTGTGSGTPAATVARGRALL